MNDTEQAVIEQSDDQSMTDTEGYDAQETNDLDDLLASFDQGESSSTTEQSSNGSDAKTQIQEMYQFVKEEREARLREEATQGINETISKIKGDLDVSDKLVKGLLLATAEDNPKLTGAFQNRRTNPEAWAKIEKQLSKDLKGMLKGRVDGTQEDKKRVVDAVRSSKSETPDTTPENMGSMSSREFESFKRQIFGE